MNVEQFRLVEELFDAAVALPEDERIAFLNQSCDDTTVRERVLRMLGHEDRDLVVSGLDEHTRSQLHAANSKKDLDDLSGQKIDSYRLLELIGEGGFGSVYMAEQREPVHRLVALKLIKLGMDTKQVIARFEAERQALAMMDHPAIARVLDAGASDSGRPYFVMELVRGVPITTYCDRHRLPIRSRLDLFIQVCHAIQHAHQKGIIHRDLKPSNILVTIHDGVPMPKVIDFGIAKATRGRLTDKTLFTEFRQFVGTPQYMSPEQAEMSGLDIDTRADIYSLGVLLYELLAGVTPFAADELEGDRSDVLRVILEQEPRKPSTRISTAGVNADEIANKRDTDLVSLQRALRGDLDWIILKSIAKDRSRRYDSAAELAHEIELSLQDKPITARPPGVQYLAGKFVRRHRVMVAAACIALAAMLTGLIFAVLAMRESNHQRDLAIIKEREAEQRLWESYVAQARAARTGNQIGRRFDGLNALANAALIRPTPELADEAIACMQRSDFQPELVIDDVPMASTRGLDVVDRFGYMIRPGHVRIESLPDRTVLMDIHGQPYPPWRIQFSGDGRYVAVKFEQIPMSHVVVWDLDNNRSILDLESDEAEGLDPQFDSFRSSPTWIALKMSATEVAVYSVPEGELVAQFDTGARIYSAATSPGGDIIAFSHYEAMKISVWNVATQTQVLEFDTEYGVRGIAWDSRGESLAGASADGTIRRWNADSGELLVQAKGHDGEPTTLLFGADDQLLASYGWDNVTRLWDADTGAEMFEPMLNYTLSGFGDRLALGRAQILSTWRFDAAAEFRELKTAEMPRLNRWMSVGPHDRYLVAGERNSAVLWDVRSGHPVAQIDNDHLAQPQIESNGEAIFGITSTGIDKWVLRYEPTGAPVIRQESVLNLPGANSFDIDGRQLAVSTSDSIEIRDLATTDIVNTMPSYDGLGAISVLELQGNWLFAGHWRGPGGQVWDTRTHAKVADIPGTHVSGRFAPNGEWFIASTGKEFCVYDLPSWRLTQKIPRDNTDNLAGPVALASRDNLAAVAHTRFDVHLIDLSTGEILAKLRAPKPVVINDLQFSQDSEKLMALTRTNSIQIWDLAAIRAGLDSIGLGVNDMNAAQHKVPGDSVARPATN